jgi:hypothetical protein
MRPDRSVFGEFDQHAPAPLAGADLPSSESSRNDVFKLHSAAGVLTEAA